MLATMKTQEWMKMWMLAGVLLAVGCAQAQDTPAFEPLVLGDDTAALFAPPTDSAWTETERQVDELVKTNNLVVVHFWAPWCHNSRAEFEADFWPDLIEENEDVTFIFVTVYNDGDLRPDVLDDHGIPARVHRFAQPDHGPSTRRANRRRSFLGLPLTWTPTTWIFNRRGRLAYAVNYGEVDAALMNVFFENVRADWSH